MGTKDVILIVDDSEINIDVLVDALSRDHSLMVALNGESAIKAVARRKPDLILLDVRMPGMDGFDVCKLLKGNEATADIPIVFLTSQSDDASERKGLDLGAVDFVAKPFNTALVRSRVTNHLELKAHRDRLAGLVRERTEELELTREATIASMAILAEYRDNETGRHIQRTKYYSRAIATFLRKYKPGMLSDHDVEMISQSAVLHDIGKVAIPDSILFKPGALTPEEYAEIQRHALFGSQVIRRTESVLGSNSFLRVAREITEFHHERWDGTGYPHGLIGEAIPISARIMAVADVYDALVTVRPYKPALPHAVAVTAMLEGDARTQPGHFCPNCLEAFRVVESEFDSISRIFADDDSQPN